MYVCMYIPAHMHTHIGTCVSAFLIKCIYIYLYALWFESHLYCSFLSLLCLSVVLCYLVSVYLSCGIDVVNQDCSNVYRF